MKILNVSFIAAAILGIFSAAPAFACISGSYINAGPPVTYPNTVYASSGGATLYANSSILSANGIYQLRFQPDGNLVLYKNGTQATWASDTQNCIPTPYSALYTVFQSDGNLVVYWSVSNDPLHGIAVWDSNTQGHPNARLSVQDDGNVVIYDSNNKVLWAVR